MSGNPQKRDTIDTNIKPRLTKNQSYDWQEYQPTIDENVKDNITSINNNIYSEEYIWEDAQKKFFS